MAADSTLTLEAQQTALRSMADSDAKAAVWRADSQQPGPAGWRSLPGTGCVILLR
jgi:hypothetical protein